jgi:hypothetical protein
MTMYLVLSAFTSRPKPTMDDNIKMNHKEIGEEGVDWADLPTNRDK